MSIQLTITFGVLIALGGTLALLLLPLPTRILAQIVNSMEKLIENKQVKVIIAMFTIITTLSLFDSLRVGVLSGNEDIVEFSASAWDQRAKKFYSQRNMYIFSFILYLEMAMVFISMLIKSTLKNKTKLSQLANSKQQSINDDINEEITKLKAQLQIKSQDLMNLKSQYLNNVKAYDEAHQEEEKEKGEKNSNKDKSD